MPDMRETPEAGAQTQSNGRSLRSPHSSRLTVENSYQGTVRARLRPGGECRSGARASDLLRFLARSTGLAMNCCPPCEPPDYWIKRGYSRYDGI
jgi:hypothetical protein